MNIIARIEEQTIGLLSSYYTQLNAINQQIAARTERPFPTKEELSVIRQLTATIRVLKAKSSFMVTLEIILRFADKLRKLAPTLVDELLPQLCEMLLPGIALPAELTGKNSAGKSAVKSASKIVEEDMQTITNSKSDDSTDSARDNNKPTTPLPDTVDAAGLPVEYETISGALRQVYWKGVNLSTRLPNGQTEGGRTLQERMYYAALRGNMPSVKSYLDFFLTEKLHDLHGLCYDTIIPLPPGVERKLPPNYPDTNASLPDARLQEVMREYDVLPDGLPVEETHPDAEGNMETYWQGRPLSLVYYNGQTEDGRSIMERIYCARFRRQHALAQQLAQQAIDMPFIERFGKISEGAAAA